jgi:predicted nuclease with TOPRIM domain
MPCTKCEEGKYKWGETGECKYDTLDACESANHKYSKMNPTPLGKKTYEEYEKELKEFNLSSQRIELGLVDDLDKLVSKQDGLIKKLLKDGADMNKQTELMQVIFRERNDLKEKLDKVLAQMEREERRWKVYQDALDESRNETVRGWKQIEKDSNTVKKQAKDLGVDIPLGKYENAVKESKAAIGKALNQDDLPF